MSTCAELLNLSDKPVETTKNLTEREMWSKQGSTIWKAEVFTGAPTFYPVYKYQSYFSPSLLSLIMFKGGLHVNAAVAAKTRESEFFLDVGTDTIDRDIVRVGGPSELEFTIGDPNTYAKRLATAMCEDVREIEHENPGSTNVILCGGRDSLNLTLLPWKNDVVVASAAPNYELAKAFMVNNHLPYDVVCLDDTDDSLLQQEILVNCCRNNLEHCRWGPHLRKISEKLEGKCVFWKGQLGDIITTPYWKWFAYKRSPLISHLGKWGARALQLGVGATNTRLVPPFLGGRAQRLAFDRLWSVCAMWQGAHVAFIRDLTDTLVLSGYHGPAVETVVSQVDLNRAVQKDIRPMVGRYLLGREVVYPATNPGPPRSVLRQGISDAHSFFKAVRAAGIPVQE